MARSKNVSRKAGGGHVSAGEDTPGRYEPPVLTQEVEALVAEAAAKADHAAQLRSVVEEGSDDDLQLSPDEDEEEDEDAAVVVSSRPNARKKRPRKDKGKEKGKKKEKGKLKRLRAAKEGDEESKDTNGQPAIDAIDAGTSTVKATAIPPKLKWKVGTSGFVSTQLRSFTEEVASSAGTIQVCSLLVSCLLSMSLPLSLSVWSLRISRTPRSLARLFQAC